MNPISVNISLLVSTRQRSSFAKVRDNKSRVRIVLLGPLSDPEPHVLVYVEAYDQLIARVRYVDWLQDKAKEDLFHFNSAFD